MRQGNLPLPVIKANPAQLTPNSLRWTQPVALGKDCPGHPHLAMEAGRNTGSPGSEYKVYIQHVPESLFHGLGETQGQEMTCSPTAFS